MASVMYKFLNPIMKGILKSPMHGAVSKDICVIEFKGRKSGRAMSTPVSYHIKDGRVHCFTSKDMNWWKNLVDVDAAAIVVQRRRIVARPTVVTDDLQIIHAAMTDMLTAVPRDAKFSNVGLDENNIPVADDIAAAAPNAVYVSFPFE
ncbi:MAG: hypothetical protein E2O92_10350 [Alphaproteobacteria bacterium]|nr:MAG: hypothetical protein E2O92_10350 [Alphaproteobacteria bacterium]